MRRASRTLAVAIFPFRAHANFEFENRSFWRCARRETKRCWWSHLDLCATATSVQREAAIVRSFRWAAAYRGTSGAMELQDGRRLACKQLAGARVFFKPRGALIVSVVRLGL
ncbi:hypothetical protein XI09_15095 [Bradyrhizobium sp. CCBAU 11386]|nr:hypothetical protein [Bradyrhizobium sp. CCBAU 11386]